MTEDSQLPLGMVFTAFFLMLGPVKILAPFAAMTSGVEVSEARRIALKAIGFACIAGLIAAIMGQNILVSWGISPAMLHFAAGIILLLVALGAVLAQYKPGVEPAAPPANPGKLALSPLAFPTILTPYGIGIFILLLALTGDRQRELQIAGLFVLVMGLNLLVMWFARPIVRRGHVVLALFGAVVGVLQVALAVKMMVESLRSMHVLPPY